MATRTVANAGGNYNAAGTWVEGVVPTSADDVVFTATSGNLTVNVTSAAKTFICTNYVGTLTMNAGLTVSGSVTLVTGMTIAGTFAMTINATATLTSNTKTWPNGLTFGGTSQTYTLADNWTVAGTLTSGATTSAIINGNTLNCASVSIGAATVSGTTSFVMYTTGSITSSGQFKNNLTFNSSGTVTVNAMNYNTGTITYTAGTVTVSGTLTIASSFTMNTGSSVIWAGVTPTGAATITLLSDWYIGGAYTHTTTGSNQVINGAYNVYFRGNITVSSGRTIGGTGTLVFNTTSSQTIANTGGVTNDIRIDATGTVSIGLFTYSGTGSITYITGTVTATATLSCTAGCTLDTSGMHWNDVTFSGTNKTFILSSALNVDGTFTCSGTTSITINGSNNLNIYGDLNNGSTTNGMAGNCTVVFCGTGTSTWTSGTTALKMSVNINMSGTLNISGTVRYSTGTITYTTGTVVTTGSTFTINATCTLNTVGISWESVSVTATSTLTLSSNLSVTSNFTLSGSITFAGTGVWTVANFINITAGSVHILVSGQTYTITTSFTITGTLASRITFNSSVGGTVAYLILRPGSTQDIDFCDVTDINSNGGQTIWSYKGTLSNSLNWRNMVANVTIAKSFVI